MTMASTHVSVVVALVMVALMAPRDVAASKTVVVDTPSGKVEGVDRGTSTCKLSFCWANFVPLHAPRPPHHSQPVVTTALCHMRWTSGVFFIETRCAEMLKTAAR
jgi:hypothetical protein